MRRWVPRATGSTPAVTARDNFIRANANPISNPMSDGSSTWQTTAVGSSAGVMQIFGNVPSGTDLTVNDIARCSFPLFHNTQSSFINVPSTGISGAVYTGPCGRIQSAVDASCYMMRIEGNASIIQVYKVSDVAGVITITPVGAPYAVAPLVANDKVESFFTGVGSCTIELQVNGFSYGTVNDPVAPLVNGQPGMFCYGNYNLASGWGADNR